MKNLLILTSLFLFFKAQGQIDIVRYNDNFSALKDDSLKKGLAKLKYRTIGNQSFLSIGGEVREHLQYFNNQNFGDGMPGAEKTDVAQLWHRIMVHGNLEAGKKTRVFLQLNSTFRWFNPNALIPEIDENRLSLHQLFVDYAITKKLVTRVGRQELLFGRGRVIGIREGPNTRLTFDAAGFKFSSENHQVDLFAATPVVSRPGVFDDHSFKDALLGIYGHLVLANQKVSMDYYVLSSYSERRKFRFAGGEDRRQVYGIRLSSKNKKWNYDIEGNHQRGSFNDLSVRAFSFKVDLNYKVSEPANLIVGIGAEYNSGDKDSLDKKLNTHNTLFSKPLFEFAAPLGSANIVSVNSSVQVSPWKKTFLTGSFYLLGRQNIQDGIYAPDGSQIRPGLKSSSLIRSKEIGTQYALEINYLFSQHFAIAADAIWFKTGQFLKETGKGENLTYVSLKGTFKF